MAFAKQVQERRDGEPPRPRGSAIPAAIALGVAGVLLLGAALVWRAESGANKVALASSPKPVTVVAAQAEPFRLVHSYVGSMRPWIEANVGPQFISAYVQTVLVRPGAVVKRGEILATLDCRYASQQTAAASAQANAIAKRLQAAVDQAARTNSLLDGGFVSLNESELMTSKSESEAAELEAQKAQLSRSALDVNDCILRAPFDGEISVRLVDPGSFVRPSDNMLGVIDRDTVRMTADAPENDYDSVSPGTRVTVHVVSINVDIPAAITRRAPSANPGTRTVHFEIDLPNPERRIPVDTTGEVQVPVGNAVPATSVPLSAVSVNDAKVTFFTVEGGVAHLQTRTQLGEWGADVFFDPGAVPPGSAIVLEGRALLHEGDAVTAKVLPAASGSATATKRGEP